jgi:Rrf2 family protein
MRTISKRTQYGLKALMALGRRYGEGPVLIATLAEEERIPIKFLELILLDLKGRGVLESKKGKHGGYLLSRPPSTVTFGSIIRMLEGPLAPLPCASETAYKPCPECQDVESCGTRILMRQVRDAMAGILDRTTLADLIRQSAEARNARQQEPLMYYI